MEISVFAPAKINLFLEVTGKRENGYHDLATLFAKLAIGDDIKISAQRAQETKIELKIKGPFGAGLKADKSNLAYKAAKAFFEHFEIKADCNIRLEKNMPLGSGLGAGSSDAAAVLTGLCSMFNIELNSKRMKELVNIAAKLGADVPVFLYSETFFKAEGIGEILTPVKSKISSPWVIIAYPGEGSDTTEAYKRLTLNPQEKILTHISNLNKLIYSIESGSPLHDYANLIYNKLEDSVLPYKGSVAQLKSELLSLGAHYALMSGSGACVFALVQDEQKAKGIVKNMSKENRTLFLTHFWRT